MRQSLVRLLEWTENHPLGALVILVAIDLVALGVFYRCQTRGGAGVQSLAAVAFVALGIGATLWHLLRFAAAVGQGGGLGP